MNWKLYSFFAILILMVFQIWICQEPEKDYSGLTEPDIAITFDFSRNERRWEKEQGGKVSEKYLTIRRLK